MIFSVKKAAKLLPLGLLLVILLANSVLHAQDTANSNSTQATGSQILNQVTSNYLNEAKSQGPDWLRNTDIKFVFTETYLPEYSLETIQPFGKVGAKGDQFFWQGRYANQNNNYTANLGMGWRKLAAEKSRMFGVNVFYDYANQYSLSRAGLGLEYFSKLAEHRLNCYIPISGDKMIGQSDDGLINSYIRAVEGFDYELGTSLAKAPWLKFYASGFYYNNKYYTTETGYQLRSAMRFTPSFSAELGYKKSNTASGVIYGKVMFQLADSPEPSLFFNNREKDGPKIDLSSKLLQKVERDNNIKTENYTVVHESPSVTVTLTMLDHNDHTTPLSGFTVDIWPESGPKVYSGNTNGSGTLTTTLSPGRYFVSYGGAAVYNASTWFQVDSTHTAFTFYGAN